MILVMSGLGGMIGKVREKHPTSPRKCFPFCYLSGIYIVYGAGGEGVKCRV
jgi:hypothetical protein